MLHRGKQIGLRESLRKSWETQGENPVWVSSREKIISRERPS